jgi:cytidylate kinase
MTSDHGSAGKPLAAQLRVIAIDGPVASGKTVVGRELAQRIGWQMLDTGIMYRALTWLALETGTPIADPLALTNLAAATPVTVGKPHAGSIETASIFVDGRDATTHLRDQAVEANVSAVAAVPGVREHMVRQQREIAQKGKMVMVGRDIGTVVVPDAAVKIYLDASPEVRAMRRATEMRVAGRRVSEAEVLEDLRRRDALDAGRATSPLRADDRAEQLDTSGLSLVEAVDAVLRIVARRIGVEESG